MTIISVKNLFKNFGSRAVLRSVNVDISAGDSLTIIGGSGKGKTVLIKCIIGLLCATSGNIIVDELDVAKVHISSRSQNIKKKFGMLFQGNALFDSLRVWENIVFGVVQCSDGKFSYKTKELAITKLRMVDLDDDVADLYPNEISGGMQKRVALARAIVQSPDVIILDEPTSGLDPVTGKSVIDLVKKLHNNMNLTVITITHDRSYLKAVATHVAVIEDGSITWHGTITDVLTQNQNEFLHTFMKV